MDSNHTTTLFIFTKYKYVLNKFKLIRDISDNSCSTLTYFCNYQKGARIWLTVGKLLIYIRIKRVPNVQFQTLIKC